MTGWPAAWPEPPDWSGSPFLRLVAETNPQQVGLSTQSLQIHDLNLVVSGVAMPPITAHASALPET